MDDFARRPADERRAFFAEAAARRDLTPLIVEKDFWVCWTLRRLMGLPQLAKVLTFKGGTSLSKAFGIIKRFSEDIDLTINRAAPLLGEVASPMASDISGKERERRGKALSAAAQEWVATILLPTLAQAIEEALSSRGSSSNSGRGAIPNHTSSGTFYPMSPRTSQAKCPIPQRRC